MKKCIITILALSILTAKFHAQQENWDTYMASYEKGPGSMLVNMDLKKTAPETEFPFLFSAGVQFTHCDKEGLPLPSEFDTLYKISDSVVALVNRSIKNKLAGTFTYQCQRRDYFYVPDTMGLRQKVTDFILKKFPGYTPIFNVKNDKDWDAYLAFIYPNDLTLEYMKNEKVLLQLQKAGDDLKKERVVDHWLYFKTESDRECFIAYAGKNYFVIESKGKEDKDTASPYMLHISRINKVDLVSISKLTFELETQAKKCNGYYDGWETGIVK